MSLEPSDTSKVIDSTSKEFIPSLNPACRYKDYHQQILKKVHHFHEVICVI